MPPARIERVRRLLAEERLDALLFFGLPNIRYLSGFTGTDGVLLVTMTESFFFTDSRYQTQAQAQVQADKVICYQNKYSALATELTNCMFTKVGFDAAGLTVAQFHELSNAMPDELELVPQVEQLRALRAVKDAAEVAILQRAATLNAQAFEAVLPLIRPGISEREIALELEFALKRRGGEVNAFDFIVASGTRGALPHGVASDKELTAGELVTIDFGTRVEGYHSDETVTLAIGEIDRNLRQIFDIVLKAHDLALAALRPGMKICDLDAVARSYIEGKGYGSCFGHGLGHGVGMEIHEFPAVSSRTETTLEEGMVITVEPGIYVPGTGGVRIEDTVLVTAGGYSALTSIPKQFMQVATG